MRALLVIDAQIGLLNMKDFTLEKALIKNIIEDFQRNDEPVVFLRHVDETEESPIAYGTEGADIVPEFKQYVHYIIEKKTPSAFKDTNLDSLLKSLNIDHVFITGFNSEFCCMFSAISAYERGYKVTFIEDATGTVNDESDYEMPGLDIRDFVGTVLSWSHTVEVLYVDEYMEKYRSRDV